MHPNRMCPYSLSLSLNSNTILKCKINDNNELYPQFVADMSIMQCRRTAQITLCGVNSPIRLAFNGENKQRTGIWQLPYVKRKHTNSSELKSHSIIRKKERKEYGKFIRWIIEKRDRILLWNKLVIISNFCVYHLSKQKQQ